MVRIILFFAAMLCLSGLYAQDSEVRNAQDTGRVKFAPGTLVGKYYGTYDTSARKPEPIAETKRAAALQTSALSNTTIADQKVSDRPQLKVNQNYDPVEVSGTKQAGALDLASPAMQNRVGGSSLSGRQQLKVNQNFDAIEVSGTEQVKGVEVKPSRSTGLAGQQAVAGQLQFQRNTPPSKLAPPQTQQPVYRETRLGSSSPEYNTYRKNDNGAGSVTISPKTPGGGFTAPATSVEGAGAAVNDRHTADLYRDTRLGSSSPEYNTYRKNDFGAGAITTNQHKAGGGSAILPEASAPVSSASTTNPIRRETGLGSSSPEYNTYRKNDFGAGAITTNQHKAGGGSVILPEASAPVSSPGSMNPIRRETRLGSSSPEYNTYRSNNNGAGSVTTNPNKGGGGAPVIVGQVLPDQPSADSTHRPVKQIEK